MQKMNPLISSFQVEKHPRMGSFLELISKFLCSMMKYVSTKERFFFMLILLFQAFTLVQIGILSRNAHPLLCGTVSSRPKSPCAFGNRMPLLLSICTGAVLSVFIKYTTLLLLQVNHPSLARESRYKSRTSMSSSFA